MRSQEDIFRGVDFGSIFELYRNRHAYGEYKERTLKTLDALRKKFALPSHGVLSNASYTEQLSFL